MMDPFTIYPAIDIRGGNCVRLVQGDYAAETVYDTDPVVVARRWEALGAKWLHVVDLDAARSGQLVNLSLIEKLVASVSIPVQVGGGVRDKERLHTVLTAGVARAVIGSAAVEDPIFVQEILASDPERIILGIDARDGWVATNGWLETSEVRMEKLAAELVSWGAKNFIFTDIARDGTLTGPNIAAIRELAAVSGGQVIASGGVRSLHDLQKLAQYREEGITGAIVGRALYTGDIDLRESLDFLGQEEM